MRKTYMYQLTLGFAYLPIALRPSTKTVIPYEETSTLLRADPVRRAGHFFAGIQPVCHHECTGEPNGMQWQQQHSGKL